MSFCRYTSRTFVQELVQLRPAVRRDLVGRQLHAELCRPVGQRLGPEARARKRALGQVDGLHRRLGLVDEELGQFLAAATFFSSAS